MIPNIKSSEGIGDGVLKSYTCGLRVYHVQRASGNPVRIPVQIISQIVSNCLDSVTERNSRKIINGELASDLYIIKEGTEFSGSGFNADYYDLNWLSNNDNVQIVYVTIHLQEIESNLSITVWGLVVKDLSTTSP
jgi:hypothetical protein